MTRPQVSIRVVAPLLALFAMARADFASAQLVLPGAVSPSAPATFAPPTGSSGKPASGASGAGDGVATPATARATPLKPPGEDAIAGRTFLRNGSQGAMAIERSGAGLQLSRLVLTGYQISRPAEACRVEVDGGPIAASPAERHQGMFSYSVGLESCPFAFDILDGAVLARGATCEFKAADCKVDPTGFWGPEGGSIGPEAAKTIERARASAESEARGQFRALLAASHGNRVRIKEIASEQASFSSIRAQVCQNYAAEDKHGFCASRITMAHAVALSAELHGNAPEATKAADATKPKPRPKPKSKPDLASPAGSIPFPAATPAR